MNGWGEQGWQCPPADVLAGIDFGEASARAAAIAGLVASAFDARFRALHSERFEPPPYFTVEQIERLDADRRAAQVAARDHLVRFVATATAYNVEPIVRDEPPVDAILSAAATADLIVLGTHGRRGPRRWWLGSVAERVVRAAPAPVLVTRASQAPPLDVFERLVLLSEAGEAPEPARQCVETLARTFGGEITIGGPLAACASAPLQRASLVAVAFTNTRVSWGLTDAVARALGGCEQPVLFVPIRETNRR